MRTIVLGKRRVFRTVHRNGDAGEQVVACERVGARDAAALSVREKTDGTGRRKNVRVPVGFAGGRRRHVRRYFVGYDVVNVVNYIAVLGIGRRNVASDETRYPVKGNQVASESRVRAWRETGIGRRRSGSAAKTKVKTE